MVGSRRPTLRQMIALALALALLGPRAAGRAQEADGWTVRTADGSRSAHFEHTVAVTEDGYRILTAD